MTSTLAPQRRGKSWLSWAVYAAFCGLHNVNLTAAEPAREPSAMPGKELARIVCTDCHVVASDQEFPPQLRTSAPPFEEIANRPAVSEQSLRHFIATTHWDGVTIPLTMPKQDLTKEDVVALSRYIMSLRKH
jgi:hypothetical protein